MKVKGLRKRRSVIEIRKSKTRCDFMKWNRSYWRKACLDFDDCEGCGAYENQR